MRVGAGRISALIGYIKGFSGFKEGLFFYFWASEAVARTGKAIRGVQPIKFVLLFLFLVKFVLIFCSRMV